MMSKSSKKRKQRARKRAQASKKRRSASPQNGPGTQTRRMSPPPKRPPHQANEQDGPTIATIDFEALPDFDRPPVNHSKAGGRPRIRRRFPIWEIAVIMVGALLITLAAVTENRNSAELPRSLRVEATTLRKLPVRISQVQTCGCETGPRGQASKKLKFSITNNTKHSLVLNPDQGTTVRLLVAYPDWFIPTQTIDQSSGNQKINVGNPPDAEVAVSDSIRTAHPLEVDISGVAFPVPSNFRLWALEPSANYVVTNLAGRDDLTTFTSTVDTDFLKPGEMYSDDRLGHGAWVFQVPLPAAIRHISVGGLPMLPRRVLNEHYIVVAVAVFSPVADSELIGLAPLPPPSDFTSPNDI